MNTNLLDLNNDILSFIGDYVKKDNIEREKLERAVKFVDNELKCLRKDKSIKYPSRPNLRKFIYLTFYLIIQIKNEEIINEYLTLKKLNLKKR